MATEKHKTTLEIAVEDRLLRQFGASLKRVFSTEPVDRFQRAQAGVTQELDKQTRAAERAAAATGATGGGARRDSRGRFIAGTGGGGGGGGGGGMGGAGGAGGRRQPLSFGQTVGATAAGGMIAGAVGRGGQAMGGIARGQGAVSGMLGAVPLFGPMLQGAYASAQNLGAMGVSRGQALAGTAGITGLGGPGDVNVPGMAQFGVSGMEMPGRMAALARQSGLRGAGLQGLARGGAMSMEAVTGISGGAMAGALGTAGGDSKLAMKRTEEAIAAGLESGMRAGKLPQLIQTIADNIEEGRKRGIKVDPSALPNLIRQFGQAGLKGEAAVTAAKTVTGAIKTAADRDDLLGALAMGEAMKIEGDPHRAALALERDPEFYAAKVLNRIGRAPGRIGGKAETIRRLMGGSRAQADKLALAAAMGEVSPEMIRGGGVGAEQGAAFISEQEAATKGAFGLAAKKARITDFQLKEATRGRGKKGSIAAQMLDVEKEEAKMGARFAPLGMGMATAATKKTNQYAEAFETGGMEGMTKLAMNDAKEMFMEVFTALSKEMAKAVKGEFGLTPEEGGAALQKQLATQEGRDEAMKALTEILQKIYNWISPEGNTGKIEDIAKGFAFGGMGGGFGVPPIAMPPLLPEK